MVPARARRYSAAVTQASPNARGDLVAAVFEELAHGPIPPDRPFAEVGLGSVQLMRARVRLEALLGRPIDATAAFEFPTLRALTAHLDATAESAARGDRVATHTRAPDEGAVAIVGMALRFPGADSPAAYWRLLRDGRSAVRRFEPDELLEAGVPRALVDDPAFVPVTGALEGIDRFVPEAFGMTPREAMLISPQQRLLLEVVRELLCVTGHEAADDETAIGTFAGTGMHLYALNSYLVTTLLDAIDATDPIDALQVVLGNEPDFAATRIAYRLGLTGPAVAVQTACSTSLVAVHLACRSVLAGDCDLAIAAAGAVHVPQVNGYLHKEGSILSASGACRVFDACADGTVGGNGVAAIMLKPLAQARADGDLIHAVIRGSAINNDGASKIGFSAPSVQGQRAVVERALAAARVPAEAIDYVQAHGTGTPLGDPIEVRALTRAFAAAGGRRQRPCVIGSVKANVGHLDTCAGLAGLIAAVLALEHREAPPQVNYETPNPQLSLEDSPFVVAREPRPLGPAPHASVSALGMGGTNAHVVLESV